MKRLVAVFVVLLLAAGVVPHHNGTNPSEGLTAFAGGLGFSVCQTEDAINENNDKNTKNIKKNVEIPPPQ